METTLTDKATPQEAAELQDTLERGYKKAYQAAREAFGGDPWGSGYQSRFAAAAECNQVAADVVYETLASGMRRRLVVRLGVLDPADRRTLRAQGCHRAGVEPAPTGPPDAYRDVPGRILGRDGQIRPLATPR